MLFILTHSLQKLKLKNIYDTYNSLLRKAEVSSATKTFHFLLKTQKTSTAAVGPEHLKVEVAD